MAPVTAPSVLSSSGALLFGFGLLFVAVTAFGAMLLIGLLNPLLQRYALARPNARSAHRVPTPRVAASRSWLRWSWRRGSGAAALGVEGPTALGFGPGSGFAVDLVDWSRLWTVLGAAVLVGVVGTSRRSSGRCRRCPAWPCNSSPWESPSRPCRTVPACCPGSL